MKLRHATLALVLALAALAGPRAAAAPAGASAYLLRPEDTIEITVLGHAQLDKTVQILPDGTFTFPRIGTVQAGGKTVEEVRLFVYQKLDKFYNNLEVNVSVKQLRTDNVTVSGPVRTPGIFVLRSGWTVRELIAAAGGLATSSGPVATDQMRATLIRRNGQRIILDPAQLVAGQGLVALPTLEPDDLVQIEDLAIQVWVDGQVRKPGLVTLRPGATVLDALQAADGETEKAALKQAYIRRRAEKIPVDLRQFRNLSDQSATPPALERHDTLTIPENKDRVLVWGGVRNPAPVLIPEGETLKLTEAISMAGGPVPQANLKTVSLVQKIDGKVVQSTINVAAIFGTPKQKGQLAQDVVLHPDDRIYVPDPKQKSGTNVMSILQSAALLFGFGL